MISSRIWRIGVEAVATGSLIIVRRFGALMSSPTRIRRRGTLGVELPENLLDPVPLFDRLVEEERQLRDPLQIETLADLTPEERGRPAERAGRFVPRLCVANRRVVHARLLQIRRHLDVSNRQE